MHFQRHSARRNISREAGRQRQRQEHWRPGDETLVSGNGRIEATEIDVSAKLPGRVQNILVNEGDFVQAGQLLVQMQIDVLEAQREEARAQHQRAIDAVATAQAQVALRVSDKAAAEAVVVQRESEFLLGKQLPYLVLGMQNFLLMTLLAVTVFAVPVKGSFLTLALASLIFVTVSTAMGLFASIFTRSQIAAMFLTMIGTMLPATQFAGLLNPVSSLEGAGRMIGRIYPATHMFTISRGVFSKALTLSDVHASLWPMLLAVPVIMGPSIALLKKQQRGS